MSWPTALLLVAAGFAAGLSGSVAGLASLFSYPALLATGLPPLTANVTNTVALIATSLGSVAGSRVELAGQGARVRRIAPVVLVGGAAGAALLLLTPAEAFEAVVPFLIAAASVVLLFQPRIRRAAERRASGTAAERRALDTAAERYAQDTAAAERRSADPAAVAEQCPTGADGGEGRQSGAAAAPGWVVLAGLFAAAVYAGYFGAAAGVLLLALLLVGLPVSLPRGNALKNVLLGMANAIAALGFALLGPVHWASVGVMAVGLLVGSRLGPAAVRRLPEAGLRVGIAVAGLALAGVLAAGLL